MFNAEAASDATEADEATFADPFYIPAQTELTNTSPYVRVETGCLIRLNTQQTADFIDENLRQPCK